MNKLISTTLLLLALTPILHAQTAPDAAELTTLLNEFLTGASKSDSAIHDRFWAEDLIYTRSAGGRVSKADVMRDVRSAPAPKPGDPTTIYTAEDVRIQQYGNTAIVAFRLVGITRNATDSQTLQFLNTGTFLKRDGKWQVVAWQSTRMPRNEQESKEQALAAGVVSLRSMLVGDNDVRKLESQFSENFVWTQLDGTQITRQQLFDEKSGGRRYASYETKEVTVTINGDTAIVRGVICKLRFAGSNGTESFELPYTLTLANLGTGWKAVAMHTSLSQP